MFLDCAIFFSITRDSGTRSKTRWKGIGHHLIFSSYDYECLFPSDKFPIKRKKRHDAHSVCPRFRNKSISRRPWIITMLTGWARYYGFIYRWIYTELEVERNESISRRMKTLGRGQGQSFVLTTMLRFYGKFNRKERKRRKKKINIITSQQQQHRDM